MSRVRAAGLPALGQGGALGLLAVAELDIGAEAADLKMDLFARFGIGAEDAVAGSSFGGLAGGGVRKLHGVLAFGIVGAADEGAEFAQLQR